MKLYLYRTSSEHNRLEKVLESETRITGAFRDEVDLINPVLELSYADTPLYNYAYLPEIERYYFIEKVDAVRAGIWRVRLHIDVLMSYKEAIKELDVVVASSQSNPYYNGYIEGYDVRTDSETKFFINNFNEDGEFVLVALYGKDRGLA